MKEKYFLRKKNLRKFVANRVGLHEMLNSLGDKGKNNIGEKIRPTNKRQSTKEGINEDKIKMQG